MRVIHVIVSTNECPVVSIDSFGVFEEQLSNDVVAEAEKLYTEKALEQGFSEEDIEDSISDGYIDDSMITISIVWNEIEGL